MSNCTIGLFWKCYHIGNWVQNSFIVPYLNSTNHRVSLTCSRKLVHNGEVRKQIIRHLHTSHDTHFICGEYQKHRTRWLNVVHRRVQWKPTKQKQRNLTGFMTIPPYLLWLQRSVFYWAKNIFYYVKHANDFSNANSKLRQKAIGTEGFLVSCSFIARWFYRSPYHDSHLSPNFTFLFRIHWWA